ncbi:porin family protein [Bacteriovoracaceae bacterium]|nr:porin family protein [Bacteriovoracaceae bacterium]
MKRSLIALTFLTLINSSIALEIDEKLTFRILKTSASRKTVLINRGAEDGVEVGNHSKFYLSIGVVARAVVIKLSPTRSVWSVYRLVNPEYIKSGELMKLKISEPIKISPDETRMVIAENTNVNINSNDPRDLGIEMADGADDLDDVELTEKTKAGPYQKMNYEMTEVIASRQFEVFGTLSYSNYSSNAFEEEIEDEFPSEEGITSLIIGGEYYFNDEKAWYSHFSLNFTFKYTANDILNYQGSANGDRGIEYFFGTHWYPTTLPFFTFKFLPYISGYYSIGSIESSFITGAETTNESSLTAQGSVTAMSLGVGAKYYLTKGIGLRAEVLYYNGVEEFDVDDNDQVWTRNRSGPFAMVALGYRF